MRRTRRREALIVPGFEIGGKVGQGRSGRVYRAQRVDTGETVALKICHASSRHSFEDVAFKLEYYLHSHLRHPNIVRAFHFGEVDDTRRFYDMDFVDTVTPAEILRAGGLPALGEMALQICRALEYSHAQGILHGDLKPSNILVSASSDGHLDVVRLADFGLAQHLSNTSTDTVQGTLAYVPPEQLLGWRMDARSDLYSLGVTLYEAIAGCLPHEGSSPRQLIRSQIDSIPISIRERRGDLDRDWATFIDSLVARNRSDRPPSASATVERISELIGRERPSRTRFPLRPVHLGPTLAMIGRQDELRRLTELLRRPGSERTVIVTGEQGIGKTRLTDEFAQQVALAGGRVYRADGSAGGSSGFEILRAIQPGGNAGDMPPLETLTSGTTPAGRSGVSHEADLERLAARFLPARDHDRDSLYVFDSLELSDLDSLEFLRALERQLSHSNALLCLVIRSGERSEFLERLRAPGIPEIELTTFVEAEVREHVFALLGESGDGDSLGRAPLDDDAMSELVAWLEEHAGGSPRRIETAVSELVRRSTLRREDGSWFLEVDQLTRDSLPVTPEERLLAGVRELPEENRALLQCASALGTEFNASIVSALDDSGGATFAEFLSQSLREGLLHRGQGGAHRFRFESPELRQAVYDAIPAKERRRMHRKIAGFLESQSDHPVPAELARHLERAGEHGRARDHYVEAAVKEQDVGAYREATRNFRKAWELYPEGGVAPVREFGPEWVHTLFLDGRFQDAVRLVDELLETIDGPPPQERWSEKLGILKGVALSSSGEREAGREILESLTSSEHRLSDPELEAWALVELGWLELQRDDHVRARECLVRAREMSLERGDRKWIGIAEQRLGVLAWRQNDLTQALEWLDRAQETLTFEAGEPYLPSVWGNRAICHWQLLEGRQAIRYHQRAGEAFARQFRRAEATRSFQNQAFVLIEMGNWIDAKSTLAAADRWSRTVRGPREASYFEATAARLAYYEGQLAAAREHAERAVELAEKIDDAHVEVGHLGLRGLIECAYDTARATSTAEKCLRISRGASDRWGVAKSLYLLGLAAHSDGDFETAKGHFVEAKREAREANQPTVLFRILLAWAETLAALGEPVEATEVLGEAREMQAKMHSRLWEGLVRLTEGRVLLAKAEPKAACQALSHSYESFAALGADILKADTLDALADGREALGNHRAARAARQQADAIREALGVAGEASPRLPAETPPLAPGSPSTVRNVLDAAAAVSREIAALQSVDKVLEKILDVAVTYLGTERGVIALSDPQSGELEVHHTRNMDNDAIADTLDISRTALMRGGDHGEVISTGDALADPELSIHESIRRFRIRSLITLPIRWRDRVVGALYMDHRELTDLFGEEERLFLQFIADMAAIGIQNARRFEIARDQARSLRGELERQRYVFAGTVGRSAQMQKVFARAIQAARGGKVVLITGPTGVGKDHVAKIIHEVSHRTGEYVNCPLPALPRNLIEGELFGVARGAATDVHGRKGLVGRAHGGTLFLNEIGDLPLAVQPVLLHFLERGEYRRVGSHETDRLDGLILCATNADLDQKVAEGSFREDLYYRITELVIRIPPLAERPEDIADLAELFVEEWEQSTGRENVVISPAALELLTDCPWDGNVRELRACVGRAVERADSGVIEPQHLESPSLTSLLHEGTSQDAPVRQSVDTVRMKHIREAMHRSGGIIRRAAPLLGVSEATLRRWLAKYRMEHLAIRRSDR